MDRIMGKKRARPADEKPVDDSTEGDSLAGGSAMSKNGSESTGMASPPKDEDEEMEPTEGLEEVMKDNLELMLDIIMKIRDDPLFAKSIYADCPRLQHILDQRPDLRPIFEDPRLVRITFEKAFIEAGGELPDNKPKSMLATIVNHPAFKALKFVLFVKKIYSCVNGGGMAAIERWMKETFHPQNAHSGAQHIANNANNVNPSAPDVDGGNQNGNGMSHDPNDMSGGDDSRAVLNDAADQFSQPDMQVKIDHLLSIDDPEQLAEAIESDPVLSALRDSNELCANLMSDPDTCQIMLDPDNLRALGECPDLIDADMSSPDWSPDADYDVDMEMDNMSTGGGMDADYDATADHPQLTYDQDIANDGTQMVAYDDGGGFDGDGDLEDEEDLEEEEEEEEEEGDEEDPEEEEEEEVVPEFEMGDEKPEASQPQTASRSASKTARSSNPKSRAAQRQASKSTFFANISVGLTDMIGGELVGISTSEIMGGGGDGLEGLDELDGMDEYEGMMDDVDADGLEDAADNADDVVDNADRLEQVTNAMETFGEDLDNMGDNLDNMESALDTAEEAHDAAEAEQQTKEVATTAAMGAAMVTGGQSAPVGAVEGQRSGTRSVAHDEPLPEEGKKFGRFKVLSNLVGAVATAAKETIATAILGDDLGEMFVEKLEEEEEEEGEKKEGKDDDVENQNEHQETTTHSGGFASALDDGKPVKSGGFAAALDGGDSKPTSNPKSGGFASVLDV